ncbi:hypothetical protein [Nocardia noduli]|uniref:hypothetical protein n=1 Tax=Nocardia noduli TaxID=2815722 RepID=UPI001C24B668|nr:hypothetical protein [Nocardia noduli]
MGTANVDEILDIGSWGLQYWEQFHPHFIKAWPDDCKYSVKDLEAKYDEQRGMNLAKLATTAGALNTILGVADTESENQRAIANRLPNVWSGTTAAGLALRMVGEQTSAAETDRKKFKASIVAIEAFINSARGAVESKAEYTLALLTPVGNIAVEIDGKSARGVVGELPVKIDGRTPDDVAKMVDIHTATDWISYDQVCWVYDNFPEVRSEMDGNDTSKKNYVDDGSHTLGFERVTPNGELAQKTVDTWLEKKFKPDFTAKLDGFVNKCKSVDDHIKAQYQTVQAALDQLDQDSYSRPAEETATTPPPSPSSGPSPSPTSGVPTTGTPTTGTPTTGTPTTGTPTTGTPTTGTPTTGTPSATNTALSGLASTLTTTLSSAATALTAAASSGLTTLTSTISEAIEDLTKDTENDDKKDDDKKDDDKKGTLAEFTLAGKEYKLEIGADGQPKLVETGPDGKTHEYSVKLDSNGIPIISDEEKKSETPSTPGTPTSGTPTTGSPTTGTPTSGTPAAGTPTSGTPSEGAPAAGTPNVTVPPTGNKTGTQDGEHTPETAPVADQQPGRSGAVLAEAGPL